MTRRKAHLRACGLCEICARPQAPGSRVMCEEHLRLNRQRYHRNNAKIRALRQERLAEKGEVK
jgi:hypothetical protein